MANRALVAKAERAASQRVTLAFDKFAREPVTNKATARAEAQALVAKWTGAVTVGKAQPHRSEVRKGGMVQGGSLMPANSQPRMKAVAQPSWEEYARQASEARIYIRV